MFLVPELIRSFGLGDFLLLSSRLVVLLQFLFVELDVCLDFGVFLGLQNSRVLWLHLDYYLSLFSFKQSYIWKARGFNSRTRNSSK